MANIRNSEIPRPVQEALADMEIRLRQQEERIEGLEAQLLGVEGGVDITQVESRLNKLRQFEDVPNPIADTKISGLPLRVLHEDEQWRETLDGIVKTVPPGLGLGRTDGSGSVPNAPTRIVNVLGSLAVTGALSADTLRSRRVYQKGLRTWTPALAYNRGAAVGNNGVTETTLAACDFVEGDFGGVGGEQFECWTRLQTAANANTKTFKVYIGTDALTIYSGTDASLFMLTWILGRYRETTSEWVLQFWTIPTSGAVARGQTTSSQSPTAAFTVKITGEGSTNNDTILFGETWTARSA